MVEEVENLMNSLLLGRVCSNLFFLSHHATSSFAVINDTTVTSGDGDVPRCSQRNFASACLHAEVAQILFNYSYSRLARTLIHTFLGQFPPSNEVCSLWNIQF